MAKIDVSKIEGFDAMAPEQKVAALQGYDFPDPDYTGWVKKETFDKTASDLAKKKKELNDRLTEEERRKQEEAEKWSSMEQQLAALKKEKTISGYKANLLAQGYDEDLAGATAAAMESGDMATFFANNKKFLEDYAKKIVADRLKKTPRGADGGSGGTMTKDAFRKLSAAERYEFSQKHPEEYRAFYETGGNE